MMVRSIILLTLLLSVVLLPFPANGLEQVVNIIYTGSMNGELEPCGCSPKTDFGGLARIGGYLSEEGKALSPYILIDAGNFAPKDTPQGRLKAEAMLKSFGTIKYDAVAFLKNETLFPDDFFTSLLREQKVPAISNMAQYRKDILIKRDGLSINVSTDPGGCRDDNLNILLTDAPVAEAGRIKGWDVIITSSGEILDEPVKVDETVIVSGYPKGKKLGILNLSLGPGNRIIDYSHRWQTLGSDIKDDPKISDIINDYDSKVAGLLKEAEKPPAGTSYLGVAKCAECHQPFEENWKKTRHASAFSSLQQVGKSADPECIVCHVVGFGEEGGFYSIETTPGLANVQCEECHGLDREHINDFYRPMKPVTKAVCLKCHTKENSPDFDYETYLEKIKH